MCSPELVVAAVSAGIQYQQSMQEQKTAQDTAKRQNALALRNRLNQERMEGLRIRQVGVQQQSKLERTALDAKKARATVKTAAENIGGGALDRLLSDYYRQEGNYNSVILNNLEQERAQSSQNFENFVTGQEANQAYIPNVDPVTTFASAAVSFGQDYLGYRTGQLERERQQKIANKNLGKYPNAPGGF